MQHRPVNLPVKRGDMAIVDGTVRIRGKPKWLGYRTGLNSAQLSGGDDP